MTPRFKHVFAVGATIIFTVAFQTTLEAQITLSGNQTHTVGAGISTSVDGLTELTFDGGPSDDNIGTAGSAPGNTIDPTLNPNSYLAQTPDFEGLLDTELTLNADQLNARAGGCCGGTNIGTVWTGTLNVGGNLAAGDISFGTRSDDGSSIFIDTSGDGVFQASERIIDNGGFHGNVTITNDVNLAAGSYAIAIGFFQGGGGDNMEAKFASGAGVGYGSQTFIDPTQASQSGIFTTIAIAPTPGGSVTVSGVNNVIDTSDPGISGAEFTTLTMNNNSQLIFNSAPQMAVPIEFTGTTTLNGAGTHQLTVNDMNVVTLSGVVSGSGGLLKDGNGILELANNGNNYTGITTVNDGVVDVLQSNGLGASGAGNETVVNSGGSVRFGNGVDNVSESFNIAGSGNSKSQGALHHPGGNSDNYNGSISLSGDAEIFSVNNRWRLQGPINNAGNDLTFRVNAGDIEIRNNGIAGSGDVIKEGNGNLVIFNGTNNTFTGALRINDGQVDARDTQSLGAVGGGTFVGNGGTLLVRDGRTFAENNIEITGTGHNGRGAIRSENNSNTLTGQVTLTGDSRIHVNNTQLTLSGVLGQSGGNRNLEKTGAGTLILSNSGNTLAGQIAVSQGTLQADSPGAVNSSSNISVAGGSALNVSGPGTLSAPVTLADNASLGNHQAGTSVNVADISTDIRSTVTFNGPGDTVITGSFGNGNSPISQANSLAHFGYHINNDGLALDLDNNGGLMGNGDPFSGPNFNGLAFLTNGPGNRGLDFDNDGDFTATGAIGQNNNYSNLWVGTFTPTVDGNWRFRNAGDDDRAGIWFDLNQNGIFESSTAGLGSNRGEQLSWEDGGDKTVALTAGQDYLIAFTHREGGGGSRADFRFEGPGGSGFGNDTRIRPSDAGQAGLWNSFAIQPLNNVVKDGSGTTTLAAANTYNGTTSIQQGTLIAANDSALGISDGTAATGTFVASGATLGIAGGVNIGDEQLSLGATATIQNAGGVNSIGTTSLAVVGDSSSAADAVTFQSGNAGDVLTAGGGGTFDLGFSSLRVQGGGEVTLSQDITAQPLGSDTTVTTLGTLRAMRFTGGKPASNLDFGSAGLFSINPDSTISQGSLLLSNTPSQVADQTIAMNFDRNGDFTPGPGNGAFHWEAVFGDLGGNDQSNFQIAWTGQFSPDATGDFTFRSHDKDFTGGNVDDDASIFVDANQNGVFEASEGFVSGSGAAITLTNLQAGEKYQIAIGYREGGGDEEVSFTFQGTAGAFTSETGINPGAANQNALFSLTTGSLGPTTYHAVKDGPGTLRLDGLIQFDGGIDANDGTLIVNADNSAGGTPTGDWDIASGATLGGNGTINLAPGASVNVSGSPGTVSPGDAGPGYDNPANPAGQFSATYSEGTDINTVGTLTFMAATSTDTALNLDGNLQLDIMGPNPGESDMLVASMGIIDIDESTAMLEINGQTDFSLLDLSSVLMGGDELLLISAADGLMGQFANDAKDGDSFVDQSGLTFTFAQDDTTLSLIAGVPEPTTIAIWTILGLAGFGFACRQRLARKG